MDVQERCACNFADDKRLNQHRANGGPFLRLHYCSSFYLHPFQRLKDPIRRLPRRLPLKCIVASHAPSEFRQSMATICDSPDCRPLRGSRKPKLMKSYRTIKDSSGSELNMVWIGTTDMNSRCSHMILRARTA